MKPALTRMFGNPEQRSSAGNWLVRGYGLRLTHRAQGWQIEPNGWYDYAHMVGDAQAWSQLHYRISEWLAASGLSQARFARRRQALDALSGCLQQQPPDWLEDFHRHATDCIHPQAPPRRPISRARA